MIGSLVVAPVKSAVTSKVNIAVTLTTVAGLITDLSPLLPPKYQATATAIVVALGGIVSVYLRTYQTTSLTPQSLTEEQQTQALNSQQITR